MISLAASFRKEVWAETYVLDLAAHTSLRDTTSTEDLHRVLRALLCAACAVHLEERDGTRELRGLFLVRLSI